MNQTIRAAAVQMQAAFGDVDANLEQTDHLVRRAFNQGAEWVILPEFFTSGIGFHPAMLDAARPVDGAPARLLLDLAREFGGVVGGSFLAQRGEHVFNTFVLTGPDGIIGCHDKDQPTMFENCYYVGGSDDGVLETPVGPVGAALCWELIRTRTARRLVGRVRMVVSGACWWGIPEGAPPDHPLRAQNLALLQATPVTFARLLGVPLVFASYAGTFDAYRPPEETLLQTRPYMGETQIVDGTGTVLARMAREDGAGFVLTEVALGSVDAPRPPIPDRFWIPELPEPFLNAWTTQNEHGAAYYRDVTLPYRQGQGRA
jgi:predicted amidohydrolase